MKYFVMINGEQQGPYDLEQLPEVGVRPSTYVWCKGKDNWEKAEDDADVCRLFRNRLYDLMHPTPVKTDPDINSPFNNSQALDNINLSPTRFDHYLKDDPEAHIPTLEEIDSLENTERPPVSILPYAWLVTLLCFPPTGIIAIVFSYKSKKAWKEGNNKLAYDYHRSAKMWTGISLFLGFILYAFIAAFF